MSQQILENIKNILAQETNHEANEITADLHLTDDLAIDLEEEGGATLKRIIKNINEAFDIDFDPELFLQEDYENQTVGFLAELVQDEVEL